MGLPARSLGHLLAALASGAPTARHWPVWSAAMKSPLWIGVVRECSEGLFGED